MRTASARPFLAYYPCLYDQDNLEETATIIGNPSIDLADLTLAAGHPPKYEALQDRENYDTSDPCLASLKGATRTVS